MPRGESIVRWMKRLRSTGIDLTSRCVLLSVFSDLVCGLRHGTALASTRFWWTSFSTSLVSDSRGSKTTTSSDVDALHCITLTWCFFHVFVEHHRCLGRPCVPNRSSDIEEARSLSINLGGPFEREMLGCNCRSSASRSLGVPTHSRATSVSTLHGENGANLFSFQQLVTGAAWQLSTSRQSMTFGALAGGSYRRSAGRSRCSGSPSSGGPVTLRRAPAWVTPLTARVGGEVVPVRASTLAWQPLSGEPCSELGLTKQGTIPAVTLASPPAHSSAHEVEGHVEFADKDSRRQASTSPPSGHEAESARERSAAPSNKLTHRRRVTWSGSIETVEVERSSPSEIFSPDLHALVIAEQLAVVADEPKVAEAARAVLAARREVAAIVRSLSASDGWSGSLDGVEDEWRPWARREILSMQKTDELVRCLVSSGRRDVEGAGAAEVYRLKDAYRAARRRMNDANAD